MYNKGKERDKVGTSATRAKNKYAKSNYDQLHILVDKGKKAEIKAHAESKGFKSLNAYINDLIERDIDK